MPDRSPLRAQRTLRIPVSLRPFKMWPAGTPALPLAR